MLLEKRAFGVFKSLDDLRKMEGHSVTTARLVEEDWKCMILPLMLICRTIYREIHPKIYEDVVFSVFTKPENLLSELDTIKSAWLPKVQLLSIRICQQPLCLQKTIALGDLASDEGESDYCKFINNWDRFCKRLADVWSAFPSKNRSLALHFSVSDLETFRHMVTSLKQLPQLLNCSIKISPISKFDKQALRVVEAAFTELRPKGAAQKPFRYIDLPEEIQLKILSFTGLVVPYTGIPAACSRCLGRRPFDICCGICTVDHYNTGCCCTPFSGFTENRTKYFYADRSAYSTSCICLSLHLDLLLVNKLFYRQGLLTLYSLNHFVFKGLRIYNEFRPGFWASKHLFPAGQIPPLNQLRREFYRYIHSIEFDLNMKAIRYCFSVCRNERNREMHRQRSDQLHHGCVIAVKYILELLKVAGCKRMKILFRVACKSTTHRYACQADCSCGNSYQTSADLRKGISALFVELSYLRPLIKEVAGVVLVSFTETVCTFLADGELPDMSPSPMLPDCQRQRPEFSKFERACEQTLMGEDSEYALQDEVKSSLLRVMERDDNYEHCWCS